MKKAYITGAAIFIVVAVVMAFVPLKKHKPEATVAELTLALTDESRFVSSDDLAQWMISGKSDFQVIDVRTTTEFAEFSLPGALSVPLDSILSPSFADVLNNPLKKTILYSDGSIYAQQAWMLMRRVGIKNHFILEGGLNKWFETIISPEEPALSASGQEQDLYKMRKAASMHFGGGGSAGTDSVAGPKLDIKPVAAPGGKKKKKEGGGC